jgi:ferredoxin
MQRKDQAYIRLQRHLNRQPVGYPATRSGAELKVLKHIFTAEEAELATCLTYKLEPIEAIFARAGGLAASPQDLARKLDAIERKGGIGATFEDDRKYYCNLPLVVGMFETQLDRLTDAFVRDFDQYTSDKTFGIDFISTKLPQMRTVPVERSITPRHQVRTFDEISSLVRQAEAPWVIVPCICRKKKAMQGQTCGVTERQETCLAMGRFAQAALRQGIGRPIDAEQALDILAQNQKQGLVFQPSNTRKAEFICSCCGCCCGMLRMHKSLPKPLDYWASNFQAAIDRALCNGCGTCEKRCQVNAIRVEPHQEKALLDLNRCLGCGGCVATCPKQAIGLVKNSEEITPPPTLDALNEINGAHKQG